MLLGGGLQNSGSTQAANNRTLYIGNLHACMDEGTLLNVFQVCGPVESVKIIKDKGSGISQGYGFIRFSDKNIAEMAMQQYQGYLLYGQEIRLNWAYPSGQREDVSLHHHIFVGDLSQEVTDTTLMGAFCRYVSCSGARVLWDTNTGRSKGYGFVSFRDKEEADRAIAEMNGQLVGGRRVRCGWAQHKPNMAEPQDFLSVSRQDPTNTNIYIGNVSPELSEEDVKQHFQRFGELAELKLHKKGGYGFVRYKRHEDAVQAIMAMNGMTLNCKILKVGWGKKSNNNSNILSNNNSVFSANASPSSQLMVGGGGGVPQQSPINQMLQQAATVTYPGVAANSQLMMGANSLQHHPHLMLPQQLRGTSLGVMGGGRGMVLPNAVGRSNFVGLHAGQYDAWMQ
eukprot:TRINITY_DN23792_c0_g1_i1.p1 TRINITY_DN23792_c0_g1~~TRINITY_DN23792_c0_g1_i1.p1  ORF type:complete len:397 (-),score=102.81 TRINITY_DN23792_c0_g1_i1:1092-2282(-)